MRDLPQSLFDVYALSLPRGHGFGAWPPLAMWQSEDSRSYAVVTKNDRKNAFGVLAVRRRVDQVWTVLERSTDYSTFEAARRRAESFLHDSTPLPVPPDAAPRPALHDLQGRTPGSLFKLLSRPSHHVAAWLLNQTYLALPDPDDNWASDCQTSNFHTRLWEAQLLASFREQGMLVSQPHASPDFRVQNRSGDEAWIEAVTANPPTAYDHVGAAPTFAPDDPDQQYLGPAAERFAKTLGSKLQRRYDQYPHVAGKPFAIALADFHAPGSMVWSRTALFGYLYGARIELTRASGKRIPVIHRETHLLGQSRFPAGLFADAQHQELSALVFSNACSISKFNRVGVSAGATVEDYRHVRIGTFFDPTPGALDPTPFCLDITSNEYRCLWPHGYEPWSAELEVFHNPYARLPLPRSILPEATHWFERNGETVSESPYETSILSSRTLVLNADDPMPTLNDFTDPSENSPPHNQRTL